MIYRHWHLTSVVSSTVNMAVSGLSFSYQYQYELPHLIPSNVPEVMFFLRMKVRVNISIKRCSLGLKLTLYFPKFLQRDVSFLSSGGNPI